MTSRLPTRKEMGGLRRVLLPCDVWPYITMDFSKRKLLNGTLRKNSERAHLTGQTLRSTLEGHSKRFMTYIHTKDSIGHMCGCVVSVTDARRSKHPICEQLYQRFCCLVIRPRLVCWPWRFVCLLLRYECSSDGTTSSTSNNEAIRKDGAALQRPGPRNPRVDSVDDCTMDLVFLDRARYPNERE